jgi:hypothetical protein
MEEKINRLSASHKGLMPIRVLQHNLVYAFENINPGFLALTAKVSREQGLDTGIGYKIEEEKVESPYAVFGKIFMQEAFLSFMWCNCFSLTVLYEESIVKQSKNDFYGNEDEKIDFPAARDAYKLWEYGISLLSKYSAWDTTLPNPELVDPKYAELIPKVNSLFLTALKFVLAHEFAHIELRHSERTAELENQKELSIKFEKEADGRAIELVLAGNDDINRVTTNIGTLIGLCSLLFFKSTTMGEEHPDTDERIDAIINIINPDMQDAMWGLATLAYRLWANQYLVTLDWKEGLESPKELYHYIKNQVKDHNKGKRGC